MASTNKTETIGLNQWVSTDYVKMADFNSDNLNIDNAIKNINTDIESNSNKIGDLSTLTTTDKTSIVNAIKENTTNIVNNTAQLSENTQDIAQLSNPNLLINGDFQVWQRGTSFTYTTNATNYTADRWRNLHQGLTSVIEKVSGGIKMTTSNYSSGINRLTYSMEDIDYNKLKGKTVTFSCNYDCDAGFALYISVGGSAGYIQVDGRNWYVASTGVNNHWNYTFVVPTDISDFSIFIQTTNTGYIIFKNVKLELGSIATSFVPRLYAEELALCQRYYEKIQSVNNGTGTFCTGFNQSATQFQGILNYVRKRISPTVSFDTATNFRVRVTGGATIVSSFAIGDVQYDRCGICANVSGSITAGQGSCLERTDSCTPYIALDAEIY